MARHRIELAPRVWTAHGRLSRRDRLEVRRIIGLLHLSPEIDNEHKIVMARPPLIFHVYLGVRVWVAYRIAGNDLVEILNVGESSVSEPIPW